LFIYLNNNNDTNNIFSANSEIKPTSRYEQEFIEDSILGMYLFSYASI
jgi:hypothetical protein